MWWKYAIVPVGEGLGLGVPSFPSRFYKGGISH